MFPVVDVSRWSIAKPESAGGDEKYWLRSPADERWLYKPRTEHDGWVQGEDWAEKISTEVANVLGVPAATVELAVRDGRHGTISRSLRPADWELQHGAVMLGRVVSDYTVKSGDRRGHTLANIELALALDGGVGVPRGWSGPPELSAFDVLAGYLMLDALVANQDRHEENWAVLRPLPGEGPTVLAGSYDHASSLGFNLQDQRRTLYLERGLTAWAVKARAQRFERATDGQLGLVELAHAALRRGSDGARVHWHHALACCHRGTWEQIIQCVPDMSDPKRSFVMALLEINHGRLLHEF